MPASSPQASQRKRAGRQSASQSVTFDLNIDVDEVFLDGIAGGEDVYLEEFERACYHVCLEHVKRGLAKHRGKWNGQNENPWLRHHVQWTAFVPSVLFHVIWDALLDRMAQHPRVRKYTVDQLLVRTLDGLWSAKWRSSLEECPVGYSSYSSNVAESIWKKLDNVHPEGADRQDVSKMFDTLEQDTKVF